MAYARECEHCNEVIEPRGGQTPRFCPFCGRPLAGPPAEPVSQSKTAFSRSLCLAALAAAVLAVISVVLADANLPFGVLAIGLGWSARREVRSAAGRLSGGWLAQLAIAVGMIATAVWLLLHLR